MSLAAVSANAGICPDGTYVSDDSCKLAPDGTYVGGAMLN